MNRTSVPVHAAAQGPIPTAPLPSLHAGTERLRVAVIALRRTRRLADRAVRVGERVSGLPDIDLVGGRAMLCSPQEVSELLCADVDLLYASGHHVFGGRSAFLSFDLATAGPIIAPAIVADTCWGAHPRFLAALARARPRQLPAAAVFTTAEDKTAPFAHEVLFAPLLAAALTGGRPANWTQRLQDAMSQATASAELRRYTGRDWSRWGVHQVQGTRI